MALSRGGAEGRTAGPLGFGSHLRPLCGPPLQQQHDFWSSPVSVGSLGTPAYTVVLRNYFASDAICATLGFP